MNHKLWKSQRLQFGLKVEVFTYFFIILPYCSNFSRCLGVLAIANGKLWLFWRLLSLNLFVTNLLQVFPLNYGSFVGVNHSISSNKTIAKIFSSKNHLKMFLFLFWKVLLAWLLATAIVSRKNIQNLKCTWRQLSPPDLLEPNNVHWKDFHISYRLLHFSTLANMNKFSSL